MNDLVSRKVASSQLEVLPGSAHPLGATATEAGVNFSVFSSQARRVTLVLADHRNALLGELRLDAHANRSGDRWHVLVPQARPGMRYGYRVESLDGTLAPVAGGVLIDPYAQLISGLGQWRGEGEGDSPPVLAGIIRSADPQGERFEDQQFDWGHDSPPGVPWADTVIYELHVRGFTRDPSAGVSQPGTFAGLTEKIPYIRALGVTAVELLPVAEFDETQVRQVDPQRGVRLRNFWGYNAINFFAPKAGFASSPEGEGVLLEFKAMVKAFHNAGIEVLLDVVFNHTGEGEDDVIGRTYSFRGLDRAHYYMVNAETGENLNFSGCGNTLNCNDPVCIELIVDALRFWVEELHVDGFRFDLASILTRASDGSVLNCPPVLARIAHDPVLTQVKLIAEAWDAAGLYQVGRFPSWGRWSEWNGPFRDDLRRFVRGDPGMVRTLATRLTGSADLYGRGGGVPCRSVNFVSCHDGFTLADLVSYDDKHNDRNGELGRDGAHDNLSWNCGVEGPTDDPEIVALRRRQAKNLLCLLMMSAGVPMLTAGDELGRTQGGNNNAYCQDNETSWVDWRALEGEGSGTGLELHRFMRALIAFRSRHPCLRRTSFDLDQDPYCDAIEWHGVTPMQSDWSFESRSIVMAVHGKGVDGAPESVLLVANAYWESLTFTLPNSDAGRWQLAFDTARAEPGDIVEDGHFVELENPDTYRVMDRSVVVLVAQHPGHEC